MPFLKTLVLLDKVEVVSSDDNSSPHLHALDHASENASSDAHVASKGTLLVDVCALAGLNKQKQRMKMQATHLVDRSQRTTGLTV